MRGAETDGDSHAPLLVQEDIMGHVNHLAIVLATLVTALLLFAVVLGGARIAAEGKKEFNLLVLTKGPFGRASLSNLQLFYFLVIVIWAVLYAFFAEWSLPALSSDTLALLGIGGAGTAGAKVTATFRRRISSGNWAWLKNKAWIDDAIEKQPPRPTFGDLVSTDGQFDVTKFQSLAFSPDRWHQPLTRWHNSSATDVRSPR
jgi:hypothetical protein